MKKLLSILLVVTFVFGMTFGASAATVTTGIKGINEANFITIMNANAASGIITLNDDSKAIRSVSDLANLDVEPGDVIQIPLTADMFTYANGTTTSSKDWVSTSALSSADITVRSTVSAGNGVLNISLAGNKTKAYIKIEVVKSPTSDSQKFSYATYLNRKGARAASTRLSIKGFAESPRIEVYSGTDYVNISKGETIKALANIRGVEIYLGNNCSITRNLIKGKEYSGTVIDDILAKDEVLFTKYPYLEHIYRFETIGMKAEGNIVSFDFSTRMYVYNSNGTFIGTTDNKLPYWTKYYLSSKRYDSISVIK